MTGAATWTIESTGAPAGGTGSTLTVTDAYAGQQDPQPPGARGAGGNGDPGWVKLYLKSLGSTGPNESCLYTG